MHPHVVWLFKMLKKLKDEQKEKGLTTENVGNFCKGMNKRKYAAAMMGALFDLTHSDTPIGEIVRDIDRFAMNHTGKFPEMKKYDHLLVDALDSDHESPLYEICQSYKKQYTGRIPDLDKTDFNAMQQKVKDVKKPHLFDPANLI
jgi:hypothetical protein